MAERICVTSGMPPSIRRRAACRDPEPAAPRHPAAPPRSPPRGPPADIPPRPDRAPAPPPGSGGMPGPPPARGPDGDDDFGPDLPPADTARLLLRLFGRSDGLRLAEAADALKDLAG